MLDYTSPHIICDNSFILRNNNDLYNMQLYAKYYDIVYLITHTVKE